MSIIRSKRRDAHVGEALYVKRGKRYEQVDRWEGYPASGVWLVLKHSHGESATCIMTDTDLADVYLPSYATAMARRDDIINQTMKHFEEKGSWSWSEVYCEFAKRLCKGHKHPDEQVFEDFYEEL